MSYQNQNQRPNQNQKQNQNQCREEVIHGYDNYRARIRALEHEGYKDKVVFVFGTTWCKYCRVVEEQLDEMKNKHRPKGLIIYVNVGSQADWQNPFNAFRNDKELNLKGLPTLIRWKSNKRIVGARDADALKALFQ